MLERYLRKLRIPLATTYTHDGHNMGAWRNLTGQMLAFFFPRRPQRTAITNTANSPQGSRGSLK